MAPSKIQGEKRMKNVVRLGLWLVIFGILAWMTPSYAGSANGFDRSYVSNPWYAAGFPAPRNGEWYVIAHRGAHDDGTPENSLAAIQRAIELGCDFVEIDVRETRDHVIVAVHDATVEAYVKGHSGRINDYTLAELRRMGLTPPTLEEILMMCAGRIGIYIDLKEDLAPEIAAALLRYHMEDRAVWYIPISNLPAIMEVKALGCHPMPDPGGVTAIQDIIDMVHPLVLASDIEHLERGSFAAISHAGGAMVFADDSLGGAADEMVAEWDQMLMWGVDGIQTDHPGMLIEYLRNRAIKALP